MDKILSFLKDVRVELSKVAWPTREQLIQYTAVVIGMSLVIAVFLGVWDWIFQWVINKFILK
ncbi:MAG: preprotein translocase subunit SecE [Candidatus Yanofskybacteria bacterium RIFCSPHIGHO2_02_FULL_41_29]|uniref:Protein translocase subunit SecE n=1 Tax=Candidatus Yanofskybacteria bacterium RIFCSPHIGHO2_01_FULL_41_53 TaxID=1802663 RepID=A0A1F8EIT9_9BACT|nr:MAG: preprotein translocase subunit SecE [Candidatus Yanofskybacteria bacterium RIFCSPHIGHO2_01_FULL_41_53]OGN11171.1 MAG: preprotein translocase subunit SecE [Candidatus Yanofskybacteria bacterium RIFCSPHIGHO2_02_FULL_41_29]OGN16839.1 MAG: preprotein translocase subunit SecE [Candidatus Yanofskybacteria bacterium RIFCSPHIGHO2_12_FULL_41_9]OGN22084.1 MAG: preprotein translocase subunit SecE [Candidatus Yanofskybacteria bacterium RIFCSPLOWO2_01_FULL_41_67]OGN28576.1 MAG: preprotein translocas